MRIFYAFLVTATVIVVSFSSLRASDLPRPRSKGFIENAGQIMDQNGVANTEVLYLGQFQGLYVQLRNGGFSYELRQESIDAGGNTRHSGDGVLGEAESPRMMEIHRIDLEFIDFNQSFSVLEDMPLKEYCNFYTAGTPIDGITDVRSFERVVYQDFYPGIDLEFLSAPGEGSDMGDFKYNFIIHEGGRLEDIRWRYVGAIDVVGSDSLITLSHRFGKIEERIPLSFLRPTGERIHVHFVEEAHGSFSLKSTHVPAKGDLVVDPVPGLWWSTFFGDVGADYEAEVAVAPTGEVYLAGRSQSGNMLATSGAHQTINAGSYDDFLARFDTSGNRVWCTYYGGIQGENIGSLACDQTGHVYLAGGTVSLSGISTPGSHQPNLAGTNSAYDAFIVKFNPAGQRIWGTYFGGDDTEYATEIAITGDGKFYVCGYAESLTGVATPGAYLTSPPGGNDLFLAQFDTSGFPLWATFFGGPGQDAECFVAALSDGGAAITGHTTSSTGIATPNAHQTQYMGSVGNYDSFVAKFSSTGQLKWSTYYGGTGKDDPEALEPTSHGGVMVGGRTYSSTHISTPGAAQPNLIGVYDGMLAAFDSSGTLAWGTYFGAPGATYIRDFARTPSGDLIVCGETTSSSGIASPNAYRNTLLGTSDLFLCRFSPTGEWQMGTYFGSSGSDQIYSLAIENELSVYISGHTNSASFPVTPGAQQTVYAGGSADNYLSKLYTCIPPSVTNLTVGDTLCEGSTLQLMASATGPVTYAWTGPGNFTSNLQNPSIPNVTASQSGSYRVMVTAPSGCQGSATANIVVIPSPVVIASTNGAACLGDTIFLTSNYGTTVPHQWTGPNFTTSTAHPFIPNAGLIHSGTYVLTVTNSNGCVGADSLDILVNTPQPVSATSNSPICEGDSLHLFATGCHVYLWYGPNSFTSIDAHASIGNAVAGQSGSYYVLGIDSNGCTSYDTVLVVVNVCSGVNEVLRSDDLEVYPNPNKGLCWVRWNGNAPWLLTLYGMDGKLLFQSENQEIETMVDVSRLRDGNYVIIVQSEGMVERKVLSKQR